MDFKRQRFLIIACGYHLPNTLGEIEKMVSSHLASRLNIVNHDGEDEPNLTFLRNLEIWGHIFICQLMQIGSSHAVSMFVGFSKS